MTAYNSSNSSTLITASRDTVRIASEVVDFSSTTNAASDTFDVIGIPANTLVINAGCDILTADSAGNSGTIAIGDSASGTYYVAAATVAAAGQMTVANDDAKAYSSANDIRVTVGTGAINAKVRVWAVMISLDKGGFEKDTESQSVTFA
jgi:hypothetical protein